MIRKTLNFFIKTKSFPRVSPFYLLSTSIVFIACFRLLNLNTLLGGDYFLPLWITGYMGEYFHRHHMLTMSLNTDHFVGLITPVFYGFGFFRIAGLLSAYLGSTLAIRIIIVFLYLFQASLIYRLFSTLGKDKLLAFCISCLVTLSIYPLTNLFIRGALAEFVATILLTSSMCCLLKLVFLPNENTFHDQWLFGLCVAGASLTHPITLMYGISFIFVFLLCLLPFLKFKNLMSWTIPNALLVFLVLSPWLYLVILGPGHEVANKVEFHFYSLYKNGLDSIWTRIRPYPFDPRSLKYGVENVSTAYLDAQISMPFVFLNSLLFLCSWRSITWKEKKSQVIVMAFSVILFFFTLLLSVSKKFNVFGDFFCHLQFGYRLITYTNLSSLCLTAALIVFLNPKHNRLWLRWREVVVSIVVTVAIMGFFIQDTHINTIISSFSPTWSKYTDREDRNELLSLKPSEAAYFDYAITKDLRKTPFHVEKQLHLNFPVGSNNEFGKVSPLTFELEDNTQIVTDVYPFPWNKLILDGQYVPLNQLRLNNQGLSLIAAPGKHRLAYQFAPDPIWSRLKSISSVTLLLWIIAYLSCCLYQKKSYKGS